MLRNNQIKNKVWIYLIVFSVIILLFLWFFQVVFLKSYYELSVTNRLNSLSNKISSLDTISIETELDDMAHDYGVCIELFSNNSMIYSSNSFNRGCLGEENFAFYKYKNSFISGSSVVENYSMINPRFNNKTLIKAIKYNNYSIFINASLEPLDATTNILAGQLILVTVLVLGLSLLVAYFISKKLSKPIININNMAKDISNGNYEVINNNKSDIKEIDELADTLNKTAKELAKSDTLKRELMANVSHDLKTPLTMIKAYAEMVRDVTYNNKKKREANLNVIIEESDRLNILVNDILELSKIQANTENITKEKFDLDKLIKSIIKRYDILVSNENYKFIYNGIKKIYIQEDKKRIEQVLYNLINNAIQYTGEDKQVTINLINNESSIKVQVCDTGVGIEKEELKYIWDKYYKIDKSYKRNTKGTGIGLSIVKNICIQNNIGYGVTSKKNIGSTFWIEIKKV